MTAVQDTGTLCGLGDGDLRKHDNELQVLLELDEDRYNAVCVLLQNPYIEEFPLFRRRVQQLLEEGHRLTSLVADLRCSTAKALAKVWTCDVQPTISRGDESRESVAPKERFTTLNLKTANSVSP